MRFLGLDDLLLIAALSVYSTIKVGPPFHIVLGAIAGYSIGHIIIKIFGLYDKKEEEDG